MQLTMRTICLVGMIIVLGAGYAVAPAAGEEPATQRVGDRMVIIPKFDDGGLASGPRIVDIYLPAGYDQSSERYPVIYFNDGGSVFSIGQEEPGSANQEADRAYDSLIKDKLIKPAILVAMANAKNGRARDLTPTVGSLHGGGLDGYYQFIATKMKPYIDSHYRTKPEPESTGISGISLGGLAAFLLAYRHPETFGLAGCMSPSLWWDHAYPFKMVADDTRGKQPVRYWIDAGSREYDMWQNAGRMYKLLQQRGWTPGDDLAAFLGYGAAHNYGAWRDRMRPMLYFLLRKAPLRFEKYALVPVGDPTAKVLDLGQTGAYTVGAEAWYANGLRLTVPDPTLTVQDAKVVDIDKDDPIMLHVAGPGKTTISSKFNGSRASLKVIGYKFEADKSLVCKRAAAAVVVDGDLSEWPSLPYEIPAKAAKANAHFGVAYDDHNVTVAVHVQDSSIESISGKLPWEQDGVEIRLDARPEPDLREGRGTGEFEKFLLVGMCPGQIGEKIGYYPDAQTWATAIPAETRAACVKTADGYSAEVSFPISYLNKMHLGPWKEFRLNICVDSVDTSGGPVTKTWWQPDWRSDQSRLGSGIFTRE